MATQTLAQVEAQLENVNKAINDCLLTGQNYSRTGFALGRVSFKELAAFRSQLEKQVTRMNGTAVSVPDFSSGGGSTESDEWGN